MMPYSEVYFNASLLDQKSGILVFPLIADWPQWMAEDSKLISVIGDYTSYSWSCWRIFTTSLNHRSVEK